MKSEKPEIEIIATNRKARFHYHIEDTFEAGIVLAGAEVKSLRGKHATLDGSFVRVEGTEAFIYNMNVSSYSFNHSVALDPTRTRKLLMKKREIERLGSVISIKGGTLVPLELYFKNGWAKVKVGIAKGKKAPDKREDIKKRDLSREAQQKFRNNIKM